MVAKMMVGHFVKPAAIGVRMTAGMEKPGKAGRQ
jgi:hypothetical protein